MPIAKPHNACHYTPIGGGGEGIASSLAIMMPMGRIICIIQLLKTLF